MFRSLICYVPLNWFPYGLFFHALTVSPEHVTHLQQLLAPNSHHLSAHLHHHAGELRVVPHKAHPRSHVARSHHPSHPTARHAHRFPVLLRSWSFFHFMLLRARDP